MSVPANRFISAPSMGSCFACALHPSWAQQRLDRAALIHCAVGLRYLVERQGHIEDLAGVDLPVPHQALLEAHVSRTVKNCSSHGFLRLLQCMMYPPSTEMD